MDADADPVVGEPARGLRVEDVLHASARIAGDRSPPTEVYLTTGVPDLEGDSERVVALVELEAGDDAGHRVPVDVADGDVHPSHELGVPDPEVPQVDAVQEQRHRTRAERSELGEGCFGSVEEAKALRRRRS